MRLRQVVQMLAFLLDKFWRVFVQTFLPSGLLKGSTLRNLNAQEKRFYVIPFFVPPFVGLFFLQNRGGTQISNMGKLGSTITPVGTRLLPHLRIRQHHLPWRLMSVRYT